MRKEKGRGRYRDEGRRRDEEGEGMKKEKG